MADVYKGLTIKFGAETTGLDQALRSIDRGANKVTSELRKVERALKFNPGNTDLIKQRQLLLAKQVEKTTTRLDALRKAQDKLGDKDINDDQYRNLQREISETSSKLEHLKDKANGADRAIEKVPETTKSWAGLATAAGAAGAALAAAGIAAGAALGTLAVKAVESADELQKQADVTGLSAERLQELQYAGANLGVELDVIVGAQAKLTKSMSTARDGGEAQAGAFKKLGINVKDSHGNLRDANVVMGETFDALGKVKNETERNAKAQKIFGKSAKDLNPLIRAGGDELKKLADKARDSGAVMSGEAVAGLDTFGDTIENIKTSIIGTFGEALAPALSDAAEAATKWVEENGPALKQTLREIADTAADIGTNMKTAFADPEVQAQMQLLKDNVAALRGELDGTDREVSQSTWTGLLRDGLRGVNTQMGLSRLRSDVLVSGLGILSVVAGALAAPFQNSGTAMKNSSGDAKRLNTALGNLLGSVKRILGALPGMTPALQTTLVRGFQAVINNLIDSLNIAIRAYNALPLNDISTVARVGISGAGANSGRKIGRVPEFATGGSFAPGRPTLAILGDQSGVNEHVLRDDQIVNLVQRAITGVGGGQRPIQIAINQPVQSYADTRRAIRDAAEELAW